MTTTAVPTGAEEITWDLSDLYAGPDDPRLDDDLKHLAASAAAFRERYRGRVGELDAAGLAEAVQKSERMAELMTRIEAFAYLTFSTDTADPARGALLQRVREAESRLSTETLFFELEWLGVADERAEELLSDEALARYRHHLRSLRRYRPHVLTEPEETIITELDVTGRSAWARLFTELDAGLRVEIDGEKVGLEQAFSRLYRPDRDERRRTAESITEALEGEARLRASVFNTVLLDHATKDRLRGYPNWLRSWNLSNQISDEAVQALVDAVVARYDIPHRYYALKARLLGLDKLKDYDRMASLADSAERMPWDEARSLVQGAYEDFSPVTGWIVQDFFERRWIDAATAPNKVAGAYCMTTMPGHHPYMLMTYTGERRSVLTLAHELGHGVHGALASQQGLYNAEVPLTLAETASVFGEALTFRRLLGAETDRRKRLELIAGRLEDTIATVFRQIALNRFEDAIHTARREGGELSVDDLCRMWLETQSAVLGDSVEVTDGYRYWWSYIHHFIAAPGYVYAYAFGYLFSLAIFRRYQEKGQPMVEPYLDLLRAGGSDTPESLARIVGIDLSDAAFWSRGLEAVDELLAEAEELAAGVS